MYCIMILPVDGVIVKEVEIIKETEKQYEISSGTYRRRLNKSDIDKNRSNTYIQVYSFSLGRGLLIVESLLTQRKDDLKERLNDINKNIKQIKTIYENLE